jgi:hypothetical protein
MGGAPVEGEQTKDKNKKGVRTAQGLLENEPLRDGDAFVRFGSKHPPLGAACLKTHWGPVNEMLASGVPAFRTWVLLSRK